MALHYTKKQDESTERDIPAEEFINLMLSSKRDVEQRPQVFNTEILK